MPHENSLANLRPFAKGVSGNKGGRPKGLASQVREALRDGQDVIDLLASIIRGETRATVRDRITAAEVALNRGWGKSVEVQLTGAIDDRAAEALDLPLSDLIRLARQPLAAVTPPAREPEDAQVEASDDEVAE